ncbi:MAG: PqqD family protein [Candidatus Sulfotelmatobacter sp.]
MSTLLLRKLDNRTDREAAPEKLFVRSHSVVWRIVGGETLIVPVRGKVGDLASIYSFNEIGSLIWKLLDVPRDLPELVAAVAQEYEVENERARKDVERFLNDMLSARLVEERPAEGVAATEPVRRVHLAVAGSR